MAPPIQHLMQTIETLRQALPHKNATVEACLSELDRFAKYPALLKEAGVYEEVGKLQDHPIYGNRVKNLIRQWDLASAATVALGRFRRRQEKLQNLGQKKADMVAYKVCRKEWNCGTWRGWQPPRVHGEIEGVPIGVRVANRCEAAFLGIHCRPLRGIDAEEGQPCYAVCISGGYRDDIPRLSDGSIRYTGCGGQKRGNKKQVADQEENIDNRSLLMSMAKKQPIRVLMKGRNKHGGCHYVYVGLYECTHYSYKDSIDGPKIYVFNLKPIPKSL